MSRCFSATMRSAFAGFCCCASCLSWSRLWAYSVRVMISLLTRAIISSTTVSAGSVTGNNIEPATANSKGRLVLFMLELTESGQNPDFDLIPFYAGKTNQATSGGLQWQASVVELCPD